MAPTGIPSSHNYVEEFDIDPTFGSGLVVTADDITAALIQDDATAASIDSTVQAQKDKLPPQVVVNWGMFYAGYKSFSAKNKNLSFWTLGLPNIGDQVVSYEMQLKTWNESLQAAGAVNLPPTVKPPHGDPSQPSWLDKNRTLVTIGVGIVGLLTLGIYVGPFLSLLVSRR